MNLPFSLSKTEAGGASLTVFSVFTLSEWFGLITLIMGIVLGVGGHIIKVRDDRRKAAQAELDAERTRIEIEDARTELAIKKAKLDKLNKGGAHGDQ